MQWMGAAGTEKMGQQRQRALQPCMTRMHSADIQALEIDLKLLDQSIAAEFGSLPQTAP
jgi:hypothetical protein